MHTASTLKNQYHFFAGLRELHMTKKDYELIAYCIFTTNTYATIQGFLKDSPISEMCVSAVRRRYAEWFADRLAKENPRFDQVKFMRACGIKEAVGHLDGFSIAKGNEGECYMNIEGTKCLTYGHKH